MPNWPTSNAWPSQRNWPAGNAWPSANNWPASFNGSFASLFPGAFQIVQSNIGILYGSTPLASAGNTSTTIVALSGVITGTPVPVWIKATNSNIVGLSIGPTFDIYYDGAFVLAGMSGVTPISGVPIPLTGAGAGLSLTWTAGTSVASDTWKATAASWIDQSGNLKDYTMATLSRQPIVTAVVNGSPGLLFDAVDDLMVSTCNCPVPGTTPWVGFHVFRRPTANAGLTRIISDSGDGARLLAVAATTIRLSNQGTAGPTAAGLPTNTWGAVDYLYSNSASDYIRTGSGVAAFGLADVSNAASVGRQLSSPIPTGVEIMMTGYAPASAFNAAAFRAAVAAVYGPTVNA